MKRIHLAVICVFLMLSALSGNAADQSGLKIMTEELPPFNFEKDGSIQGICADVLIQIMEKAGKPVNRGDMELVPWARGYRTVSEEPGTMLFSMARTPERESLFRWVGPVAEFHTVLIAPKNKHIVIKSFDDMKKYRIGVIRDGAPEQMLVKGGIDPEKLDKGARADVNIRKLIEDRIDLMAFNLQTGRYMMKEMGINPNDYEAVYELKKVELYFAFHKDTDAKLIADLNQALEELKKPGADGKSQWQTISEKYIGAGQ